MLPLLLSEAKENCGQEKDFLHLKWFALQYFLMFFIICQLLDVVCWLVSVCQVSVVQCWLYELVGCRHRRGG
jgi:hypothetical protein